MPKRTQSKSKISPKVARPGSGKATAPVVKLTAKQSSLIAAAGCAVEIRDHVGKTIGHLLHTPEITRFYTPAEFAHLLRRAANPTLGRSLKEILREAEATAKAMHELRGGQARAGV